MTLPLAPLAAAIGSALSYSLLDLLRKVLLRRVRAVPLLFYMSAGTVPAFALWSALEGGSRGYAGLGTGYWLPALTSVVLNILANLAFLESVRRAAFSRTIPLLSLTPVFTTLLAIPLLGEVPGATQLLGIAAVVLGAFLLNLGGNGGVAGLRGDAAGGAALMAAVALLWSLATPLDKLAMERSGVPFHATVLNLGVAAGMLAVLVASRRVAELRLPAADRGSTALAVLATLVALALFLFAISEIWVGVVETIKRGIGSTLALLLGGVLFGERVSARQVVAVVLMTAGVVLVLAIPSG